MNAPFRRRRFLLGAAALSAAGGRGLPGEPPSGGASGPSHGASTPESPFGPIIDANVSLSRWPTRRLPLDEPAALAAKLRSHGVERAWAGTFDALLHKDLRSANERLAEICRVSGGLLVPFGALNPTLPDWESELDRCAGPLDMPGIRLHPNHHGYKLDDPAFARLLGSASARRLIVQIALHAEDERMMHPLFRTEPADAAPLADAMARVPGARVVLLNALNLLRGEALTRLLGAGGVYVEIATLEGAGGIASLLGSVPAERVLFGSHAPLFIFESALLKLKESAGEPGVGEKELRAIAAGNARRLAG